MVQKTIADYLRDVLGWASFYAWNDETFGPLGMLGRDSVRDTVLKRDLRAAITRLNSGLPESAREDAFQSCSAWIMPGRWFSTIASSTDSSATACRSPGVTQIMKHTTATRGSSTFATARQMVCRTTGSSPCAS